jgi:hypothetical protein
MRAATLTFLAAGLLTAPLASQGGGRTHFDGASRVELPATGTTVPLEQLGPFFFAEARLGGKTFRFTVETGANHVAVSQRLVDELRLPVETITTAYGTGPVVRLPPLSLGSAVFHDVVARVTPGFSQEPAFDGLISIPLLYGVVAAFDFPAREIRLGGEFPAEHATAISWRPGERVALPIELAGARLSAVLDTRSPLGVIVPDSIRSGIPLAGPLGEEIRARGPSLGEFVMRAASVAGPLTLAGQVAANPIVYFRNRPGVVLGMPVLEQFLLTLDLAGQRAALTLPAGRQFILGEQPGGPAPVRRTGQSREPEAPPSVSLGFGLIPQPNGGKVVAAVAPGSSAAKEGLRDGDRIVTLDGVAAEEVDPAVLRRAAARGGPVTVVIRRGDRQLEFTILPHVRQ